MQIEPGHIGNVCLVLSKLVKSLFHKGCLVRLRAIQTRSCAPAHLDQGQRLIAGNGHHLREIVRELFRVAGEPEEVLIQVQREG